jgi:hypothetical protein
MSSQVLTDRLKCEVDHMDLHVSHEPSDFTRHVTFAPVATTRFRRRTPRSRACCLFPPRIRRAERCWPCKLPVRHAGDQAAVRGNPDVEALEAEGVGRKH